MGRAAILAANWRSCTSSMSWRSAPIMASGCHQVNAYGTRVSRPFARVFSNGKQQTRYIREIVFGQRGRIRYDHLTTDRHTLPPERTWYIMTNLEGKIQQTIGNTYGLRT